VSYCEQPEFYEESFPKAQKEHRCVECSAPIRVDEKHLYYRGKWDGDFAGGRQHTLCRELCMLQNRGQLHDECIPFGGLKEAMESYDWSFSPQVKRELSPHERTIRELYAKIRWRERKYRTIRRITHESGRTIYWKKKWGQPWQMTK